MDSDTIGIKPFVFSLSAVVLIEAGTKWMLPHHGLGWLGMVRVVEAITMLVIVNHSCKKGLSAIGLSRQKAISGIKKGLLWAAGFGVIIISLSGILCLFGINPVKLIQCPLPRSSPDIFLYFLVGGVIAPVAEEICFRGILFGFLKKWGVLQAILSSTLIFVVMHPAASTIPLPQLMGGLIFAASFEIEKSLLVPIIIHAGGNLAIFTLSLI